MKKIKLFWLLLLLPLVVFAAATPKTKVQIDHVTARINGEAVVVDGYHFYVSTTSGFTLTTPQATVPEQTGDLTAALASLVPPPAKGTFYVKATAFLVENGSPNESSPSNEVAFYANGDGTFFVSAPLGAPGALRLI